jgi:hypothetical protein
MNRRTRCKRNQKGGGLGGNVEFAPGSQIVNNDLAWKAGSSCMAAVRPGFLTGVEGGGLPGINSKGLIGGGRRRRGGKKGSKSRGRKGSRRSKRTFKQRGGRYGFDADSQIISGSPGNASYAPITSVPCEASRQPVPDSGATGQLNNNTTSPLWKQSGGALPLSGALVTWPNHGAASGSPSEMVPTARYTQNADAPIVSAAGTNIMINKPINYPEMNPACKQTGGRRRSLRRRSRSRKNTRKSSRRSRRH